MKKLFLLLVLLSPSWVVLGCGGGDVVEPPAEAPTQEELDTNEEMGAVPQG